MSLSTTHLNPVTTAGPSGRPASRLLPWRLPRRARRSRRGTHPVRATFVLAEITPSGVGPEGTRLLHGVLRVPGLKAMSAMHRCVPPVGVELRPGAEFPAVVDLADPYRMTIHWP